MPRHPGGGMKKPDWHSPPTRKPNTGLYNTKNNTGAAKSTRFAAMEPQTQIGPVQVDWEKLPKHVSPEAKLNQLAL